MNNAAASTTYTSHRPIRFANEAGSRTVTRHRPIRERLAEEAREAAKAAKGR